ncbi:MAG: imidazole glycerol phosphate synthase subunit HisH [Rhodospirillales bacterium]|nr:imidazole glycerol phosphate synthase subunit HisH [Rhodospirillales bacterium]
MARSLVTLIDYGSGNLPSAAKALERAAREGGHEAGIRVTDDPDAVLKAERVVLPGVGAFAACRDGLLAHPGLAEALQEHVRVHARPLLGICVGMQLMATQGCEHGIHSGFGWIGGEVVALRPDDPALKIPHMGWNALKDLAAHPVLDGIEAGDQVYFVHSYHMCTGRAERVLATADHGGPVTAIVGKENLIGTQFHPEKSQAVGLHLLSNFLGWRP